MHVLILYHNSSLDLPSIVLFVHFLKPLKLCHFSPLLSAIINKFSKSGSVSSSNTQFSDSLTLKIGVYGDHQTFPNSSQFESFVALSHIVGSMSRFQSCHGPSYSISSSYLLAQYKLSAILAKSS
ncbi:hypothetical protein D3C77_479470 [compost metagenome]